MLTVKSHTWESQWRSYLAAAFLLLTGATYLLHCGSSGPTRVNVTLIGTSPDTDSVRVTFSLNGVPDSRSPYTFQKNTTYFGINFPNQGAVGLLDIAVGTYSSMCLTGSGQTQVSVDSGKTYEVQVTFDAATKKCPITVTKSGDGTVQSDLDGINCGQACTAMYPIGTRVALNALPTIAGSPYLWAGKCSGGSSCSVTVDKAISVNIDFTPRICTQSGFCWEYPRPQGANLAAVWLAPDQTMYSVGDNGTILRGGNGVAWSSINSTTSNNLRGIWGSSATDLWVVGFAGTIIHFDGNAWSAVTSPSIQNLQGVWGSGPKDVWAVGNAATVLHFDGNTWSVVASGAAAFVDLTSVWGSGPTDVWAVGRNGTILHNTGAGWGPVASNTTGPLWSVWGTGPGDVWAVGAQAMRWNGTAWARTETPGVFVPGDYLWAIWGSGTNTVWAAGGSGRIYRWDGLAWSLAATLTPNGNFTGIAGAGQNVWAVGTGGAVSQLTNGTWQLVSSPAEQDLYAVWMNSSTDGWAVGDSGIMYHTKDGLTWTKNAGPSVANLKGVWGSGTDSVWAVGANGTILRYNGIGWTQVPPPSGVDISTRTLTSVHGSGPNDVWIAGSEYTTSAQPVILHWDGLALSSLPTPPDAASIVYYKGAVYVAAGRLTAGIYRLDGTTWNQVNSATATQLSTQGDVLFAIGTTGVTRFDGTSWTMDTTGQPPFSAIYESTPTSAWAVIGFQQRLMKWDGSQWSNFEQFSQVVNGIGGNGTTDTWVVGAHGSILHLQQ